MTNAYLTIVNDRYALRALALYRSLEPHLAGKQYRVYCIDDRAADFLESLSMPGCSIIRPGAYETDMLRALRARRPVNEYCWTLKPVAMRHALDDPAGFAWSIYLDSDVMVFGDPDDGIPAAPDAHAVITPHRPKSAYFAAFIDSVGIYNAGYAAFRSTPAGRRALAWWEQRCIEDSPSVPREGVYADQRYLNHLPELFEGVVSSPHKGLNAGPWNILDDPVTQDGTAIRIGGDPLLTYHMQGFRILGASFFNLYAGPVRIPRAVRRLVYRPYAHMLARAHRELCAANGRQAGRPDENFWTRTALLREAHKAVLGQTNLYPLHLIP